MRNNDLWMAATVALVFYFMAIKKNLPNGYKKKPAVDLKGGSDFYFI